MPGYVPTLLHKFQHKPPACDQDAPHPRNKTFYGKQIHLANQQSSSPHLNYANTNRVPSINITFWYYACTLDTTMLPDVNGISTCQYVPTQEILENATKCWNMY